MAFFETFVALRYLRGARRQKGFISLSTFISMIGVAVGVMALIVVIGVMAGFTRDLTGKILSVNAHIMLLQHGAAMSDYGKVAGRVKDLPGVAQVSPFIYSQVMFSAPGNISGGVIRGIDPAAIRQGDLRGFKVLQGRFADLASVPAGDPPGIAIGNELARNLNLTVGDYLNLISPLGSFTSTGRVPKAQPFRVCAIFHSGMYDFDSNLAYTGISSLQEFLGLGNRVTGLEVEVRDIYAAHEIGTAIQKKLGPNFYARDWMQSNRSLFAALKLQKAVLFIILTLIILVAAFGISSTLFMMVMKKSRDIAILKTMGATRQSIMRIFTLKGLAIGLIGTTLGLAMGLGLCALLQRYEFIKLPREVYYLSTLTVQIQVWDLLAIVGAALAITFLSTLYPSWQAARLDPVEAIRYE